MHSQGDQSRKQPIRCLMVEPTGRGSHDAYVHALAGELLKSGVEVILLTSSADTPLSSAGRLLSMTDSRSFSIPVIGWILRNLDRAARLLVNHHRVKKTVLKGSFSIVHLQVLNAVFLPSLKKACRRRGTRLVVTLHNTRSHYTQKRIWNGLNQLYFRRHHHEIDAFVAHTPYHQRGFVEDGVDGKRISVIPYGPHLVPSSSLPSSQEKGTILMAGALRANKGVDNLLAALKILDLSAMAQRGSIKVNIVGFTRDGRLARRISRVANRLHHVRLSHVNRHLPVRDYAEYFARSLVLVLPYTQRFFSLSAVLLDGYFHDNELVVTDVGANGEVVREDDSGDVVPPENPEALAQALQAALARGHNFRRSANRRRSLETRFNWVLAARKTAELYSSLLK